MPAWLYSSRSSIPAAVRAVPCRRARTLTRTVIGVVILVFFAALITGAGTFVLASSRANGAAQQALDALHYARGLAVANGRPYAVEFSRASAQFRVCEVDGSDFCTVNAPNDPRRLYRVNLNAQPQFAAITLTLPLDPFRVTYSPRGSTDDIGTLTFADGAATRTITISSTGDAQ